MLLLFEHLSGWFTILWQDLLPSPLVSLLAILGRQDTCDNGDRLEVAVWPYAFLSDVGT